MNQPKQWFVGGYVRDLLLGIDSKDIDIMVELPSFESLRAWIKSQGHKIYKEHPESLIIRAHSPVGAVDYNLPRNESAYSNNRSPDSVTVGTFKEDMERRDFTCNAIAMRFPDDKNNRIFVDQHGGIEDIKNHRLRMVGNAYDRLEEDHLRIVRAIRFCATKGFSPCGDLEKILINGSYAKKLLTLPVERIQAEIWKALSENTRSTLRFLSQIHPLYTETIFSRGLWLLPTLAKKKNPPQV